MDLMAYKEYLTQGNFSENSVKSYIYDVKNFETYLRDEYGLDIIKTKKAHILTYLVAMQKSGKSSSTIIRTVSTLRNFFTFLKNEKLIEDNPVINIRSPKQIKKKPPILTEEEIGELMMLPDKNTFKGIRDLAMLELMYSSGINVSELISIKIGQVNLSAGMIFIKGDKERIIPLSKYANEAISIYLNNFRKSEATNDDEYLFVNITGEPISRQGIWKMLKYYKRKMNLKKELSPMVLRSSFAVHLLSHGADLGTLKELMGLNSTGAAQHYLNNVEYKSLEVFKKTFPRS
ncbi:MAG TPA: tyrosine-type recombinase/integrase [Sedimentibacter sp.]|jgi:integrase/recombinase XerD|nr:tyrosine-type recombinase/integrase [Sedimentibacter sp.]HOW22048.1 tyrosine-type recombinase/integrase [Sedimentibacter sp.]